MDNFEFSTRATVNGGQPPKARVFVGCPLTSWHSHFLKIMAHNDFPDIYKNWNQQKDWVILEPTGGAGSNKGPWEHAADRDLRNILLINGFSLGKDLWGNLIFDRKWEKAPTVVKGVAGI